MNTPDERPTAADEPFGGFLPASYGSKERYPPAPPPAPPLPFTATEMAAMLAAKREGKPPPARPEASNRPGTASASAAVGASAPAASAAPSAAVVAAADTTHLGAAPTWQDTNPEGGVALVDAPRAASRASTSSFAGAPTSGTGPVSATQRARPQRPDPLAAPDAPLIVSEIPPIDPAAWLARIKWGLGALLLGIGAWLVVAVNNPNGLTLGWFSNAPKTAPVAKPKPVPAPPSAPQSAAEAAAQAARDAAAAAAVEAASATQAAQAASVASAIAYPRATVLERSFLGVYQASIDKRPAVLMIADARPNEPGRSAVTDNLPTLHYYHEPPPGQSAVVYDLKPLGANPDFTSLGLCPAKRFAPDMVCVQPQVLGEFDTPTPGEALSFTLANGQSVRWTRVPSGSFGAADGEPLFDALLARGSVPSGPPTVQATVAWQPMLHAPTGVQWDSITRAPNDDAQRELNAYAQTRLISSVTNSLRVASRGDAVKTATRVTYANSEWLVMQIVDSALENGKRRNVDAKNTFSLATGKQLAFTPAFRYATVRKPDGSIAFNEPGNSDAGILGAALTSMGNRASSACMARWLTAHQCVSVQTCAFADDTPEDMALYPTASGVAVQFTHWRVEAVALAAGKPLAVDQASAKWPQCVTDTVVLPWESAKRALKPDVKLDWPAQP